jgi:Na+/H+-dicarboxylate symporter
MKNSLATRIIIGLLLGVLTGVFLGEMAGVLRPVADGYIRLMQMTVIPYLTIALIAGLGQMDGEEARRLARNAGPLVLLFWGIALTVLACLPLAFPAKESAHFFSQSTLVQREELDLLELYIPANPFHSLANSVIPAIVLFATAVGIGLIGLPGRQVLIDGLQVFGQALGRVTRFVVSLTPIGVFAIGAVTAGTMSLAEVAELRVYFVVFIFACLVLTFGVLPLLVVSVTPFSYREVVGEAKDALITAFVTQNLFIVLPMLIEATKRLVSRYGGDEVQSERTADILMPVAFNVPMIGKLMTLLFIPFAAWLVGTPLAFLEYPGFLLIGLTTYFAKASVALPFLLDLMGLPQDLFHLYIPTGILNGQFDTMLSAMNLLVLGLIGTAVVTGIGRVTAAGLLRFAVAAAGLVAVSVLLLRTVLGLWEHGGVSREEALRGMHLSRSYSEIEVRREPLSEGERGPQVPGMLLAEIRERGVLRVGYAPTRVPFSFFNLDGELVGFDVELAEMLADDIGVRLMMVPMDVRDAAAQLEAGEYDIAISMTYAAASFGAVDFSIPYMHSEVGFLVADADRAEFETVEALRSRPGRRIAVPVDAERVRHVIERYFDGVPVDLLVLETAADIDRFLAGETDAQALMTSRDVGMPQAILHPRLSMVVPKPEKVAVPRAFAVRTGELEWVRYLDEWVIQQNALNRIAPMREYWIEGQGLTRRYQRWSVIRDVLHWVD